ncbi:serine/threonine protein kinase [Saccharopolyspora griseoalba]|uniref:non-specific serine/threonine protein kinase n=1 Tax=Saccharopolyspora griseoalba TaxID=1431848 RepID=A0ABW2LDE0_9PSEU
MQWQFGPYRVEGLIARGGMGEIVRAYDTRHDRIVALKLLAPHLAADQEFRERFKREAHAAGRLSEPHVIPIHGYGEIDGRLYLDMRLVEGQDLGALLAERGAMRPADVVAVIEQVAQALDAAHREGLVHRDVKPSNVLIGQGGFAYLVDFGIAASLRDSANRTSGSTTIGTVSYMAPERFGGRPYDHRADVYSLACLLHECLTGTKPFGEQAVEALIYAHVNRQAPRASEVRAGVPEAFDQVVATGMAKDPAQRHGSAGELARAARQALRGTLPLGAGDPARKRSKWPMALVGVGAVAVLAGAAVAMTTLQPDDVRPTPTAAPTSEKMQPVDPQDPLAPPSPPVLDPAGGSTPAPAPEEPATAPAGPTSETSSAPPPTSTTSQAPGAKICKRISSGGEARGVGCFHAHGDELTARDLSADGKSVTTVAETDYGRTVECSDTNTAAGGPVSCDNNLKESGEVRIRVELWDDGKKVSATPWSKYVPIGN